MPLNESIFLFQCFNGEFAEYICKHCIHGCDSEVDDDACYDCIAIPNRFKEKE
jgi:hypothetical protein